MGVCSQGGVCSRGCLLSGVGVGVCSRGCLLLGGVCFWTVCLAPGSLKTSRNVHIFINYAFLIINPLSVGSKTQRFRPSTKLQLLS